MDQNFADVEVDLLVEDQKEELEQGVFIGELADAARRYQRMLVSRIATRHVKGTMHVASVTQPRKETGEKVFRVARYLPWVSDDASEVIEALSEGKVIARVGAVPGKGKTTYLAPRIADAMGVRVCLVTREAALLVFVKEYGVTKGYLPMRSAWVREKRARFTGMTYADFISYALSNDKKTLFADFDVFIFDEAHLAGYHAWCALRLFAAYQTPENSLLLASATISTDVKNNVGSKSLGEVNYLPETLSVDRVVDSGKLVGKYLRDRTLVLLPSDDEVWHLHSYYDENGIDVRFLDSASSDADAREVDLWLRGDCLSPRVVVAHERFGICYNLPVEFVITWASRTEVVCVGDTLVTRVVPYNNAMVLQNVSRTGRGIASGSGALVMTAERSEDEELYESDKMKAFAVLIAGSIRPMRNAFWAKCWAALPNGLPVHSALNCVKVDLPVEVVVRCFGDDGNVAKSCIRALTAFSHPDHFLYPSESERPSVYSQWPEERIGGYGSSSEGGSKAMLVKVPMRATGELRVAMHAIGACAVDLIEIPRWRPAKVYSYGDSSDEEEGGSLARARPRKVLQRLVTDRPLPMLPEPESSPTSWQYRSSAPTIEPRRSRRGASVWNKEDLARALKKMDDDLVAEWYKKDVMSELPVTESEDVAVTTEQIGEVVSPGGSVVCEIPYAVCHMMNEGKSLVPKDFVAVIDKATPVMDRFVTSKLFDCFAGPWDSFMGSLLDKSVLKEVTRSGRYPVVYEIVGLLQTRFYTECMYVFSKSNVFRGTFDRLFRRKELKVARVMAQVERGAFTGVAQTAGFVDRVISLKDKIDKVLLMAEEQSVYLPLMITSAQRGLPVGGAGRLGAVGRNLIAPMKSTGELTMRGGSKVSKSDTWF